MSVDDKIKELARSQEELLPTRLHFVPPRRVDEFEVRKGKYAPLNRLSTDPLLHSMLPGAAAPSSLKSPTDTSSLSDANHSPSLSSLSSTSTSTLTPTAVGTSAAFPDAATCSLMRWRETIPVGAGLNNLGNTCYCNSVLQCLTYIPMLANLALQKQLAPIADSKTFSAGLALQNHIHGVFAAKGGSISPRTIADSLRAIGKQFRLGRQEDAHEFLRCLVDKLPQSHMKRIFGGKLRSQIKVLEPGIEYESNTFDDCMDLSLEIAKGCNSLHKCLQHFTAAETLDGENRYRYGRKLCKARKQMLIHTLPNVLVIQFKRFEYSGRHGGKVDRHVEFPTELDVGPFTTTSGFGLSSPASKEPAGLWYDLVGVLVHSGYSLLSGHYYAFIKASNDIWYRMDDSSVSKVGVQFVQKERAYILFYARRLPAECQRALLLSSAPVSPAIPVSKPLSTIASGSSSSNNNNSSNNSSSNNSSKSERSGRPPAPLLPDVAGPRDPENVSSKLERMRMRLLRDYVWDPSKRLGWRNRLRERWVLKHRGWRACELLKRQHRLAMREQRRQRRLEQYFGSISDDSDDDPDYNSDVDDDAGAGRDKSVSFNSNSTSNSNSNRSAVGPVVEWGSAGKEIAFGQEASAEPGSWGEEFGEGYAAKQSLEAAVESERRRQKRSIDVWDDELDKGKTKKVRKVVPFVANEGARNPFLKAELRRHADDARPSGRRQRRLEWRRRDPASSLRGRPRGRGRGRGRGR